MFGGGRSLISYVPMNAPSLSSSGEKWNIFFASAVRSRETIILRVFFPHGNPKYERNRGKGSRKVKREEAVEDGIDADISPRVGEVQYIHTYILGS
jgi:hypothetical protein